MFWLSQLKPDDTLNVYRPEPWEPGAERYYLTAFNRVLVTYLITTFRLSIRQACLSLNLSKTVLSWPPGYHSWWHRYCRPWRQRLSGTHDRVFRNLSRLCYGGDTRGITKGSTIITVSWSWVFAVRANNGCRYAIPHHWLLRKCWPVVIFFACSTSLMTLIRRVVDEIELSLPPLRVAMYSAGTRQTSVIRSCCA